MNVHDEIKGARALIERLASVAGDPTDRWVALLYTEPLLRRVPNAAKVMLAMIERYEQLVNETEEAERCKTCRRTIPNRREDQHYCSRSCATRDRERHYDGTLV